ncbi:SpoIIE family protein phosphatase [Mycolicibacterium sp.]|uniref:PP2C family protein-serine/threonine phosphatase n=1 Tax=Mycolicibacterium sp. TaxID=2320850 RepID=UPI001A2614F6|nr:SpoIIE family protein phosphatase [Mycolicibacterium sp.]MBJ7337924.1 SpoIIE family protein phosphatase [Mycolicibacterium sp.]
MTGGTVDGQDAFDNAPCGYVLTTPDGEIRAVNATISSWLGRPRDELIGTPFATLLTGGGRIHYETHFAPMLLASGVLSGVTVDLVASDGRRIPVLLTANVKADAQGRPELVRIVADDAADRRSYERELLAERKRAEDERGRAVSFAETLQLSLLPPSLSPPPGLEAAAHYYSPSAGDVGGDFYDLFPLSRERYGFFLGDVCGKGVAAATLTSLTRYTLRAAAVNDGHPVGVLHTLDSVLKQDTYAERGWFCTVLFGLITSRADGFDVEIATGGHPPPLLLQRDGSARYVSTDGGQAVGLFAKPRFTSVRVALSPGDTLVTYSDGYTEARTGVGSERFDDDGGLLRFASARAPADAHGIVEAMRALVERLGVGVEDDAAVLALGVPRG